MKNKDNLEDTLWKIFMKEVNEKITKPKNVKDVNKMLKEQKLLRKTKRIHLTDVKDILNESEVTETEKEVKIGKGLLKYETDTTKNIKYTKEV